MKKKKQGGPVGLLPDFRYSAPYHVDGREEEPDVYPAETHPSIHAYNPRAEARKKRFLKDASDYLIAVGRELERYGFRPAAAVSNPGGIAVSGDVWADYYPSGPTKNDRFIYINISETCVDILGEAPPIGGAPATPAFTTRRSGRWSTSGCGSSPGAGRRGPLTMR